MVSIIGVSKSCAVRCLPTQRALGFSQFALTGGPARPQRVRGGAAKSGQDRRIAGSFRLASLTESLILAQNERWRRG